MCPAFKVRLFYQTILGTPIVHVLNGEKRNFHLVCRTRTSYTETLQTDAHAVPFRHSLPEEHAS